jgi:mono/diheme cytochrome c family protein
MRRQLVVCICAILLGASVAADLIIEATPERVERGAYLVRAVLSCTGCHSERDATRYGFPPKSGRELAGGRIFAALDPEAVSPNITPYALGDWTDQELVDAITLGVGRNGEPLHPVMPFERYARMQPDDLHAVVAYLRTMPAMASDAYPRVFPLDRMPPAHTGGAHVSAAEGDAEAAHGEYLFEMAGCRSCHYGEGTTPASPVAGGRVFALPGYGIMRAANLSPDVATGLGAWTRQMFIGRFRGMRGAEHIAVERGDVNTVMHWWSYSYMSDADLGALYAFLQLQVPVENAAAMNRFEALAGTALPSSNWSDRRAAEAAALSRP